jgi:small-conductance mechanosensitive channel
VQVESALALSRLHLVGVDQHTLTKLVYTAVFIAGVVLARTLARVVVRTVMRGRVHVRARFWSRQGINLATAVFVGLGLISIWFDNGLHAAAAVGVLTAAFAFAMQKAVTSFAGYFLILRGDIFSVGDRIVMGGVRGDVIGLGFLRTTILEMGQPHGDDDAAVPMWVRARQYTGRIVTVTNGAVFDEPVYNYSRDFPFIWEELHIQVKHDTDIDHAERLMVEAARRHCLKRSDVGAGVMHQLRKRYFVPAEEVSLEPEVFCTLTSSWIELALRFVVPTHDIRRVKSNISRDVAEAFADNGIDLASNTYAIVEVPPLTVTQDVMAPPYPDDAPRRDGGRAPRDAATDSDGAPRSPGENARGATHPTP